MAAIVCSLVIIVLGIILFVSLGNKENNVTDHDKEENLQLEVDDEKDPEEEQNDYGSTSWEQDETVMKDNQDAQDSQDNQNEQNVQNEQDAQGEQGNQNESDDKQEKIEIPQPNNETGWGPIS